MNDYTEQEQLSIARQWLKDNGKYFIGVIGSIVIFYAGWSFYQNYQQQQIESSAKVFSQFEESLSDIIIQSSVAREKANIVVNHNRHAVLCELNQEYIDLAKKRIEEQAGFLATTNIIT